MQFEDFALYNQIPSYSSSQPRILLFWKPHLIIPVGFDIFIGRFVQVHVESSHQSGNNQIQFCRREATWCRLANVKDSIEVDIEGNSYLIPRHCLGPLEKATSMLSKRSPFSCARIQRSGSKECGSGNNSGFRCTKRLDWLIMTYRQGQGLNPSIPMPEALTFGGITHCLYISPVPVGTHRGNRPTAPASRSPSFITPLYIKMCQSSPCRH